MSNVKFKYVREGMSNKDRVLTVAYAENEEGTVSVGYSVNQPEHWGKKQHGSDYITLQKFSGDTFSKKKGRMIALGRLENTPITVLNQGRKPLVAALVGLKNVTDSKAIKKLCEQELSHQELAEEVFATWKKKEKHA